MGRYLSSAAINNTTTAGAKKIYFKANVSGSYPQSAVQQWTVPTTVSCATFEIWGGGGSGSPVCCCTCWGGSPGSGGAYSIKTIAVTPGATYTIMVGIGGCANQSWYNGNACGCIGGTSYVTGSSLSNFCAEGGPGGFWCNSMAYNGCVCAAPAYGGDLNLYGRGPLVSGCCWSACGNAGPTGSSPFGGGWVWHHGAGSVASLDCGSYGIFPGGGGTAKPMFANGWCDCCYGCNGGGADGLVVITI